jgi:4-carboxymuconolactone decarboxylase
MNARVPNAATPQGFQPGAPERLPLPSRESLTDAQRSAADAIIAGPRKAIFGPFVPLLQCPALMECIGATGEVLRFKGRLPDLVRELVILLVARETGNQFEWQTHAPLARRSGCPQEAIDAIADGRYPHSLEPSSRIAADFAVELMRHNGISDRTYRDAAETFGEAGAVELCALVGYFTMVCWIMNVARTPGPAGSAEQPLAAWPA